MSSLVWSILRFRQRAAASLFRSLRTRRRSSSSGEICTQNLENRTTKKTVNIPRCFWSVCGRRRFVSWAVAA